MSRGGELWVDPEGVSNLGRPYSEQAALFRSYLDQLGILRNQYGNSWGNDELGQKFSEKFLEGLTALEGIIGTVADTLEYTGDGLNLTGRQFRAANDDAGTASYQLHSLLDGTPESQFQRGQVVPDELAPTGTARRALAPTRMLSRLERPADGQPEVSLGKQRDPATGEEYESISVDGRTFRLRPIDTPPGDELITKDGNLRLVSVTDPATGEKEFTVVSFDGQAYALDPVGERRLNKLAGTPSGVLSSTMFMPNTGGGPVLVDGVPLAEGYEILGADEIEDGTVRLDVNGYESIVPLGQDHTVTGADGQPITADDNEQLFIVKRDPDADPYAATVPGYEPHYANFGDDGSAVPYVTDVAGPDLERGVLIPGDLSPGVVSSSVFVPPVEPATILVDGTRLGDGYQILGANEIQPGTVRLDANYYDSITPIDPASVVTTRDGQTITPQDGQHLFVVREVPESQRPNALDPGYRPNYVDFRDDGTAIPFQHQSGRG